MTIESLPLSLQPLVQEKFLDRHFAVGLQSRLGFRAIADRESIAIGNGETLTKTRAGLLMPVTAPLDPATNLGLDNGVPSQNWGVEQYTVTLNAYGGTMDLNIETSRVAIGSLFIENSKTLGVQALQSLDRLARNALYGVYLGGSSFVMVSPGADVTRLGIDNVVGFEAVHGPTGMVPVSSANPMTVSVGSGTYTVIGAARDSPNTSSLAAFGGASGTITVSAAVPMTDSGAGSPVVSAVAPTILRPNNRPGTAQLIDGDRLTSQLVLAAVAQLRDNNVPDIDGYYNCYLDNVTLLELFQDPDFKLLYSGAYGSEAYSEGQVPSLLGVRFINTTEAPQQTLALTGKSIHRAILCGQGALIEGGYAGLGHSDLDPVQDPGQQLKHWVDGVCLVVRRPIDRFQEIVSQSWKWRGGFTVPTDITADSTIIPTASLSYWKRAVVIECL